MNIVAPANPRRTAMSVYIGDAEAPRRVPRRASTP